MISRMLGAARLNVETYEDVESDGGATIQALLIVILVTIASFVGRLLSGGDDINVVTALSEGLVLGIAGWAIWALVTWMVGATILKTEQTEADWGQLARGMGFAQTPKLLYVFVFIPYVGGLIGLVAFIWSFACMVIAVRQCLDYTSTLRAFFVILISFIPVAFLYLIVAIIVFLIAGGNGET